MTITAQSQAEGWLETLRELIGQQLHWRTSEGDDSLWELLTIEVTVELDFPRCDRGAHYPIIWTDVWGEGLSGQCWRARLWTGSTLTELVYEMQQVSDWDRARLEGK